MKERSPSENGINHFNTEFGKWAIRVKYSLYALFTVYMGITGVRHGLDFWGFFQAVNNYGHDPSLPGYCPAEPIHEYAKELFNFPPQYNNPSPSPDNPSDILSSNTLEQVYGTKIRYPSGMKVQLGKEIENIPIFQFLRKQRESGNDFTLDIIYLDKPYITSKDIPPDIRIKFQSQIDPFLRRLEAEEDDTYKGVKENADLDHLYQQLDCITRNLAKGTPSLSPAWRAEQSVLKARIKLVEEVRRNPMTEKLKDKVLSDPVFTTGYMGWFVVDGNPDGTKPPRYVIIVAAGSRNSDTYPMLRLPLNFAQLLWSPLPPSANLTNLDRFDIMGMSNRPNSPDGPESIEGMPWDTGSITSHELNHFNNDYPSYVTPHPTPDVETLRRWKENYYPIVIDALRIFRKRE